ncbi:MAG: anti-sigma factor [Gemmatimonadales bacterium]
MRCPRAAWIALATAPLVALMGGCAHDEPSAPIAGATQVALALSGLRALDRASEGTYEAWAVGSDGSITSAGRFDWTLDGQTVVTSPIRNPTDFMITVEPPGDDDAHPSPHKLLGGAFVDGVAVLDVNRYVTAGIPLEPKPGTHVLFTPSDNAELGYPSYEDAGIWVFNIGEDQEDGSFFITLTPLTAGWTYEGWVVRDYNTAGAVWVSYGKFAPDNFRRVNRRDDTGLGPYSGQIDYRYVMPQEIVMPGDDWLANPQSLPVPGGLTLPFDLNGNAAQGAPSRWTHVITIEPWGRNREPEMPYDARPFLLQPYRNPIGEGGPEVPRVIEFYPGALPRGTATLAVR